MLTGCPGPVSPEGTGAGVHGSVYVRLPSKGDDVGLAQREGVKVYLPDFKLFLKNADTGEESTTQTTDLYGRFMFPKQKPGTYEIRWKQQAGWAKGQYPDKIIIRNNTQYPGPVEVTARKRTGVLVGRVKLGDGGSPWFYDEFFGINKTATITVVDTTGNPVANPVRANAVGEFAVAGLPKGDLRVRATSEAEVTEQLVPAAAVSFGGPISPINLTFKNRRPQIQGFVAKRNAAPSETIKCSVRAHDYDGDPLKFEWRNPAGTGNLTPAGGSVDWELPMEPGQYTIYVVASDGKGGYATGRLTVQVGATDEVFSGRVVDQNGAPVTGATVVINSTIVSSSAQGAFLLRVPLSDLYVMNISKPGFALFSRRFDRGKIGQVWRLVRAQVTMVDPSKPIDLVDRRPELEKKQQKGVRIRIPADSLIDAAGNKPTGLISAAVATLDIANGEAPGDWGAMEGGREVNLISYGAAFVEFSDSAGKKYNLAADKTAEVALPAPPSLLAKAPDVASFWSYDEKDGLWKPLVEAKLDKNTGSYIGGVKHFSTINTDLSKDEASCLKVILDSTVPTGLKLRITDVPGGTDFGQVFEFVMDATVNAVYRLPPNTNVKLDVLDSNDAVIGNLAVEETPGVPLPGNIVNSGPPIPPGETLWPDVNSPEIDNCKTVTLKLLIPEWGGFPGSPFLTLKGVGNLATANAYYAAVDPNNLRTTLGAWWNVNGFDANGEVPGNPNHVRTSYLNNNDLGFGRDMHVFLRPDGTVAAYVTNYGNFDQNPANADLAATKTNPGATVCMEYSPVEGQDPNRRIVKFFVYNGNGNGAAAPRQPSAELDGFGQKFVPNLCLNCHGGSYYNPATPTIDDIDMQSSFREFDLTKTLFISTKLE